MPLSAIDLIAYRAEAIPQFEQRVSLLRETVTVQNVDKGESVTFPIFGTEGQIENERDLNGDLPTSTINKNKATAVLKERSFKLGMTGFEIFASIGDLKAEMTRSVSVIQRGIDDEIISTLAVSPGVTKTTASLSLKNVTSYLAILQGNNAGKEVTAVISPAAYAALMSLPAFTSVDYSNNKLFDGTEATQLFRWAGVNFIVHPNLKGINTAACEMYFYAKPSIGHGMATKQTNFEMVWDIANQKYISVAIAFHGAVTLQPKGIVKVIHDDAAQLV